MKKQLKILNLIDIPWNSGITDYAIKQAKALELKGHKLYFAAPHNTICYKAIQKENFEIINISERKKFFILKDILNLKKFVKEKEIKIINSHTGRTQSIAIILSYFNKDIKIIRTKADARKSSPNILSDKVIKIICASNFIKQNCLNEGFNENKLLIIPPPAPKFNIPLPDYPEKQSFRIGILARLGIVKGHKYFLDTAAILLKKNNNLEFLIGGYETNITYDDLKNYSKKLGIFSAIKFEGKIEKPEEFIKKCHIGIITSIGSEAVSRVLLEWMSAGRPVIATNVGCIPEILDEKYIVPAKSPDLMAEKILHLINDKKEFLKVAINNKDIIEKRYNNNIFSEITEEQFLNL